MKKWIKHIKKTVLPELEEDKASIRLKLTMPRLYKLTEKKSRAAARQGRGWVNKEKPDRTKTQFIHHFRRYVDRLRMSGAKNVPVEAIDLNLQPHNEDILMFLSINKAKIVDGVVTVKSLIRISKKSTFDLLRLL